jgi:probable rRNA maturation factor
MILLDPDLVPASPKATSAKRPVASGPTATPRNQRIPFVRTLAQFLALAQAAVRLKGEVTVLLTTDAAIRKLNRQFRGQNKATDVLSFPAEGIGAEEMAGDLAVSVPTALRQAIEQGHSLSTEIKVLILHGLLHLAGCDHEADEGQMARREGRLRERLGLPQGLIERAKAIPPLPQKQRRGKDGAPSSKKSVILSDRREAEGVEGPAVRRVRQAIKPRVPQVSILRPGKPRTSVRIRGHKL